MAPRWLSREEAAVALGCSIRSLHRKIGTGELESRVTDGRREVLVGTRVPDGGQTATQAAETLNEQGGQIQLAAGSIGMANRLAEVYDRQVERIDGELRRSRRWSLVGWIGTFAASLAAVASATAWYSLRDSLTDSQAQLTEARQQAQVAIQGAAEDRQTLTQALQSAQADLQEAILDAQEAAQQKITNRTTDSPFDSNLGDSGVIGGVWPELGAVNPFGQLEVNVFAAGLMPGGNGEH